MMMNPVVCDVHIYNVSAVACTVRAVWCVVLEAALGRSGLGIVVACFEG